MRLIYFSFSIDKDSDHDVILMNDAVLDTILHEVFIAALVSSENDNELLSGYGGIRVCSQPHRV